MNGVRFAQRFRVDSSVSHFSELLPLFMILVTVLGLNHCVNIYKSVYSSGSVCLCTDITHLVYIQVTV